MLALQPGSSTKRGAVWHIHVIEVYEDEVNRITGWYVPDRPKLELIDHALGRKAINVSANG